MPCPALRRVVQQSLAPREEDVSPSVVRQLQLVLSGSRVDYFSSAASGGVTGALASLLSREWFGEENHNNNILMSLP